MTAVCLHLVMHSDPSMFTSGSVPHVCLHEGVPNYPQCVYMRECLAKIMCLYHGVSC